MAWWSVVRRVVRWGGYVSLALFWLIWAGLLGLWYLETPLGVGWLVVWQWIDADAIAAARYYNAMLPLVTVYSVMLLALHCACELWPFHRLHSLRSFLGSIARSSDV